MDDFFDQFKDFFEKVKDITNVRFNYMKELYNLGIDQFPDNNEILNIQNNNHTSIQQGSTKLKKNWTDDDRKVLIWLIGKYMAQNKRDFKLINEQDWVNISSMMLRRDSFQCKQKWLQMLKLPLQQAPWTQTEDEALIRIINDFQSQSKGNKWSQIATALNKYTDLNVHRNGKQCRERWNNHLNPSINRNPWQLSEDLELMKLAIQNGKKWAQISKKLKLQRSENNVKNRFNCLMRKERSGKHQVQSNDEDESDNDNQEESMLSEPSAEELSQNEVKSIQQIIKKIEWRMKQDGALYEIKQEDQEQQQKKIQLEKRILKNKPQIQEDINLKSQLNITSINNLNANINNICVNNVQQQQQQQQQQQIIQNDDKTVTFQVQDFNTITQDQQNSLTFCLVNKEKNILYFATQDQISQYLKQMSQGQNLITQNNNLNQQMNQNLNSSLQNLLGAFMVNQHIENVQQMNQPQPPEIMSNPQSLNSYYQMMQYNTNQLNYSQQLSQRSVLNLPTNLSGSYTQLQSYPVPTYNYHLACYPQQQQNNFQQQIQGDK